MNFPVCRLIINIMVALYNIKHCEFLECNHICYTSLGPPGEKGGGGREKTHHISLGCSKNSLPFSWHTQTQTQTLTLHANDRLVCV